MLPFIVGFEQVNTRLHDPVDFPVNPGIEVHQDGVQFRSVRLLGTEGHLPERILHLNIFALREVVEVFLGLQRIAVAVAVREAEGAELFHFLLQRFDAADDFHASVIHFNDFLLFLDRQNGCLGDQLLG